MGWLDGFKDSCRERVKLYLNRETGPPPAVFFTIVLYCFLLGPEPLQPAFYLFAILLVFFFQLNLLWSLPSFLSTGNPVMTILMFAVSALSCNQKGKALIFLFCMVVWLAGQGITYSQVITLSALFMCLIIYKSLVFDTISENKQFFTGFFAIMLANTFINLSFFLELQLSLIALGGLTLAAGALGYSIILFRFEGLRGKKVEQIKSPREMAYYITLAKEDMDNEHRRQAKMGIHQRQCENNQCYCKNPQYANLPQYYVRQMFQNAIKKFLNSSDPILLNLYIEELISHKQISNALYYMLQWVPLNYFSSVAKLRCEARVQAFLSDQNSSNVYEKEYVYALEYDHDCLHVITEIYEILKLKIRFWQEVAKEAPLLWKLQKAGCEVVTRMFELNMFYSEKIKPQESKLYSFDSTVIYAMYLISTTSFKDYAKSIIKNTAKLMEEVSINENNSSETYGIRTIVKDSKKSFIKDQTKYFKTERERETKQVIGEQFQNNFRLVIDMVNSGFCRLINISKRELLGKELNYIIPDGYKEVHNIRLSHLLDFENDQISEITPSKVFHKELKLPIKGANNELYTGFVCIKFHLDISLGMSFISIIKRSPERTVSALLDFTGNITEQQQGFNSHILQHSEIQKYLRRLRVTWKDEKVIKPENFNVMANSTNYGVTISSPLLGLFLEKQNLLQSHPPIHIDITNEESNKHFSALAGEDNKVGNELKRMEKMLLNYDQESSASSTKGISSAVNILSVFSENNVVPIYKYIVVTFFVVILLCMSISISFYMVKNLEWDNSRPGSNPVYDCTNFYQIMLLNMKAELNLQDALNYHLYNSSYDPATIASYFNTTSYPQQVDNEFQGLENMMKLGLQELLSDSSDLMKTKIDSVYDLMVPVPNIGANMLPDFQDQPTHQDLPYHQIQTFYVSDYNLVQQHSPFSDILTLEVDEDVRRVVNTSNLEGMREIVDGSIGASLLFHYIFCAVCAISLCLLLIPMAVMLRKRYQTHERVYDLLASVDSEEVIKETKSLLYISNILHNYNQSHEIIKGNVLDYQENVIKPKREDGRRRSAENELIIGLEKYDISQSQEEDKFMITDRVGLPRETDREMVEKTGASVFSMIKTELADTKKIASELKKRKRSGQLDTAGSEFDPDKKVSQQHCFFYVYILLFLIQLAVGTLLNVNYARHVQTVKEQIIELFKDQTLKTNNLIRIKTYLRGGLAPYSTKYGVTGQTAYDQLTASIQGIYVETIYTGQESNVLPACPGLNFKLCEKQWSLRIVEGELESLAKDLLEEKMAKENANLTSVSEQVDIHQKIYYLQALSNKIFELRYEMGKGLLEVMFGESQDQETIKKDLLLYSVLLCGLGAVIGLLIIGAMKKQYLTEVYMLTFLNDTMITKNKRVESYLESLSKNNYI